jgi:succinylarginine dihydrolase
VTRLVFAARRQSDRRIGLVLLIVAVSLWAAGAAVVNASGQTDAGSVHRRRPSGPGGCR